MYTSYDISQASLTVSYVEKSVFEYNEGSKEVIEYLYEAEGNEELKLEETVLRYLDENGRLDKNYSEHFYPKEKEEEAKAVIKGRALELEMTNTNLNYSSKDKKGNITLSYNYGSTKVEGEDVVSVGVANYYEQSIEYFDGSKSEAGTVESEITGGSYVVSKVSDDDLIGNVKSVTTRSYYNPEWNEGTQKVETQKVARETVSTYDEKGVLVNVEYITTETGSLEKTKSGSFKYDDKFRITSETQNTYVEYGQLLEEVEVKRIDVTYDDANKTAKVLTYSNEYSEEMELINTQIHKLAADGTVSGGNFERFYENGEEEAEAMVRTTLKPKETPDETYKNVEVMDANGNWVESYELNKEFKNGAFTSSHVYGYTTRTITYN